MLGIEARGREEEMRLPRLSREMWDGGESGEWSAVILLLYRKMDLGMFDGSYRIGIVWVIGLDWVGLGWHGMAWNFLTPKMVGDGHGMAHTSGFPWPWRLGFLWLLTSLFVIWD